MPYCRECSASLPAGAKACPTCGAVLVDTPTAAPEARAPAGQDAEALGRELAAALAPRYELLRQLGAGGMGLVFLAREPALKRLVAVKLLAPDLASDPAARSRFEREARAAAALSHPNVVRVYAVGETASLNLPYIVMQYVEGQTLADAMVSGGRMGERQARRILGDVAAALAAAHAHDLVHRDVKPSNVLIEKESRRAYVADFGVSAALSPAMRAEQTRLTATGMMIGTPVYMSPEQASAGDVGPASDVYSLGVLGYELLTGSLPFTAATPMGWAAAHLRDTPTPVAQRRSDVSPEVALLVDRCLRKDPAQRPTAAEVARGMLPSLESEIAWPPPGLHDLAGRGRMLSRLALVAAVAGVAVLLLLAFPPERLFARGPWLQWFATQGQNAGPFAQSDRAMVQRIDASLGAWRAGVIFAALLFASMVCAMLSAAQRAFSIAMRHRVSGWRWVTLADVLADGDGRSGLVLAGAREFASLDAASRVAVLRSRRIAVAADVLAAAWVTAVFLAYIAAELLGGLPAPTPTAILVPWVVAAAVLPALASLAAGVGARVIQRSLLGTLARRKAFAADPAAVATWYEAAPGALAVRPVPALRGRLARAGAGLGLTLATLVVLVVVANVVSGTVVAFQNARYLGPRATVLLQEAERYRAEDRAGAAAELLRPYLPAPQPATDSEIHAWLDALGPARNADQLILLQRVMRAEFPVRGGSRGTLFSRAFSGRLGRDTLAALAAVASDPRLAAFRRLARARAIDLNAVGYRPLRTYRMLDDLPWPRGVNRLEELAEENAIAALADVARRDVLSAEQRLTDNYLVWQALRAVPLWWSTFATSNAKRWTFSPLGQVERLRGNRDRANSLEALGNPWPDLDLAGAPGLGTDLASLGTLRGLVADERFSPAIRLGLVDMAYTGLCANPKEVVFGPSPERRDSLLSIAAALRNVPHVAELADLTAKKWDFYLNPHSVRGMLWRANYCGVFIRSF